MDLNSAFVFRFHFLAVFSLLIFRYKEPELKRPFKVWLGTPILFCMVALFLFTTPFLEAPFESLSALGFVLLAVPIWLVNVKYRPVIVSLWNSKSKAGVLLHQLTMVRF